ncbi:helix-turn-helix domain-containing protein [Streptomyces sp. NPDC059918]|uniref:helix-turn-helix domain-containing protein n=1 Tax=unclassified Streptomyces TaxID=2593676 RepID=UPI00365489E2
MAEVGREHARGFGPELRRMREEQGISLRALARRVVYSAGWLSKVENGVAPPTPKLAELCDTELGAKGELAALARCRKPEAGALAMPAQLPRGAAPFVGRVNELRELNRCLADAQQTNSGMTVVVDGAPGAGKSTLVTQWAHANAHHFGDGILFRDLRGFSGTGPPLVPAEVLEGFLGALGVPSASVPYGTEARAALFRTLVAGRRVLVVLDNAAGSHQVGPLLPGSPSCGVVVTSRRQMTGTAAHAGARRLFLGPMSMRESVDLFACVLGSDRVRAEPEAVRSLAVRCARLPLALRIAAERLAFSRHRSIAGLAGELDGLDDPEGKLDLLADGDVMTVRIAFEASYRWLDAESSRAFRLLALTWGRTVSSATAAALFGRPAGIARRLLEGLVSLNLLQEVGRDQYRLDRLLLLYASARAAAEEERTDREAARQRLDAHSRRVFEGGGKPPVRHVHAEPANCSPATAERAAGVLVPGSAPEGNDLQDA